MGHTKEPWRYEAHGASHLIFDDSNPRHIASVSWVFRDVDESRQSGESWIDMHGRTASERESVLQESVANARRIVAAVNFCAGIPNEALEAVRLEEVVAELRELVKFFKGYQGLKMTRASRILSHFDKVRSSTVEPETTPTAEGEK